MEKREDVPTRKPGDLSREHNWCIRCGEAIPEGNICSKCVSMIEINQDK